MCVPLFFEYRSIVNLSIEQFNLYRLLLYIYYSNVLFLTFLLFFLIFCHMGIITVIYTNVISLSYLILQKEKPCEQ